MKLHTAINATAAIARTCLIGAAFLTLGNIATGHAADLPTTAETTAADAKTAPLLGTWKVDLRPKPGAADYYKTFEITAINGKHIEGNFYGTPISNGVLNADWDEVVLAFVTADQSGEYHHSATLVDGHLVGISHSIGRNFVAHWTAVQP